MTEVTRAERLIERVPITAHVAWLLFHARNEHERREVLEQHSVPQEVEVIDMCETNGLGGWVCIAA